MKKLIFIALLFLGISQVKADDTSALQASITAGNYTATSGHAVWVVGSTIHLTHNFNMNGTKVHYTGTTGAAFDFPASGGANHKLSNGEIYGNSNVTNTSGATGIAYHAANDTVSNVRVHTFTGYGINAPGVNGIVILNSKIYDTGYIGVMIISDTVSTSGHVLINDTISRAGLAASTVPEAALHIKGGVGDTIRNPVILGLVLNMPYKPTDWTAECFELRYCTGGTFSKISCNGGSIGVSIVASRAISLHNSTFINQQLEAIELADARKCFIENNSISNQVALGILFDTNATWNIIANNNIKGCPGNSIQLSTGSNFNYFIYNTIATVYRAIDLEGTNNITLVNNTLTGGTIGVMMANSTGTVKIYGGSIKNFSSHAVNAYANTSIVVNNITMTGVITTSTPGGFGSTLSGGASLGSNIHVN